jgi:sugar lactone lactonase YvrE
VSATEPILAFDARMELGESPLWDERTGTLLMVDIERGIVARFHAKRSELETVAVLDDRVGSIALRRDGGLIAAAGTSIVLLDERSNGTIGARLPDADGLRFNDGACDAQGRYWIGSMALDLAAGRGTLCRFDDRGLVPMVAPVSISNGIDWSADGTRMYYVDTPSRRIDVFTFDARDGSISDRRTLVEVETGVGDPDGLIVDAEDHVWVALWDGWAVRRYRPDGSLERTVELPVSRPTSCAFGGDDLGDLYITSARVDLSPAALEPQPHAGGLFVLQPGVCGRAPNRFSG